MRCRGRLVAFLGVLVAAVSGIITTACRQSEKSVPVPGTSAPVVVRADDSRVPATRGLRRVRATGTVRAVRTLTIVTPQVSGQSGRLTLTKIIVNGAIVKQGDPLVTFDRTQPADEARELVAKVDELKNQIEQKTAENRSEGAKRTAEMRDAEAELSKARIQLAKGPVVSEIDRLKAEVRMDVAKQRMDSLKKSHASREKSEAAALRVLQLKKDRQQVGLERAQQNLERLVIRAPIGGMVALQNTWRNGTMGPAQEGDQVFPGRPLLIIFDPGQMVVETQINQADGAALAHGTKAKVHLDAYPNLVFDASLEFASPVAAAALDSPIRVFPARFRIQQTDTRLLPDLSAAVDIVLEGGGS